MAVAVIDYGQELYFLWVVAMDDGGEIWCVPYPQVRMQTNWSMRRHKKPPPPTKIAAVGG